jgi:putative transposase
MSHPPGSPHTPRQADFAEPPRLGDLPAKSHRESLERLSEPNRAESSRRRDAFVTRSRRRIYEGRPSQILPRDIRSVYMVPARSPRESFIDPGKPWQNGADESFNGKFRDQHLSLQWFRNRAEAKVSIEQWRRHYNDVRPHSSLAYLTPAAFKAKHLAESIDGGRSPAMPARADQEEQDQPLTDPISAVLQ